MNNSELKEKENNEKEEIEIKENKVEKNKVEEKNEKTDTKEEKNIKNKKKKTIIFVCVITVFLIIISTIFAIINLNNKNIISGVSIQGIDVSGLSKEEAKEKFNSLYNEKLEKEILAKYQDYETEIIPKELETNYKIDDAVEEAFLVGRKNNILINNYDILFTLIGKKNIKIEAKINEDIAKQRITDIGSKLPGSILEPSYYKDDNNTLTITKGKAGIKIDEEQMLNEIKNILNNIDETQNYIEIPVKNKEPDVIDIEKIHQEIYQEAKDAYYTKDPFQIYPEVYGVDFNIDEAKEMLKEDKESYNIKLIITKPKVTVDEFGSEAFPNRLAIFTTKYDAGNKDRTTNLRIACQKINGKVLASGETFSYNQTLGERSIATGYKEAKVFSNGEVVDGIGGGICQISSTLYNAVVMANLGIVERRNHQFVTSYASAGRDATVVYGLTDFKFKNTRKNPIKINANIQNGIATVSIYGVKEEQEYDITFETKTIGTTPFSVKYVEDANVDMGKEIVKQKGANGIQTETYKIMSLDGKVVSRTLLSRDTYTPMQKIIIKGTKGAETKKPAENDAVNNKEPEVTKEEVQKIEEPKTETPKEN